MVAWEHFEKNGPRGSRAGRQLAFKQVEKADGTGPDDGVVQ